jgi:hypothetical protein
MMNIGMKLLVWIWIPLSILAIILSIILKKVVLDGRQRDNIDNKKEAKSESIGVVEDNRNTKDYIGKKDPEDERGKNIL